MSRRKPRKPASPREARAPGAGGPAGRKGPWLPAYWVGAVVLMATSRPTRLRCEACGAAFGQGECGPAYPCGPGVAVRCPRCGSEDVEVWPAAELVGLLLIGLFAAGAILCGGWYLAGR